mgnify:CR=1 FL=1
MTTPQMRFPIMVKWRARLASQALALVLACLAPALALADNAIRTVSSSQQGGAEVVRIEFDEPLSMVPKGFVVQTPPRVALDLPASLVFDHPTIDALARHLDALLMHGVARHGLSVHRTEGASAYMQGHMGRSDPFRLQCLKY